MSVFLKYFRKIAPQELTMPRAQNNNNNPVSPRSHSPQTPLSLRFHSSFRNILKNGRLRLPSSADPSLVVRGKCASQHPNSPTSKHPNTEPPNIQTSQHPNFQTSKHPNIQTSKHPNIQTSEHPNFQTSKHPNIRTSEPPPSPPPARVRSFFSGPTRGLRSA